jgi:hypothetical protein
MTSSRGCTLSGPLGVGPSTAGRRGSMRKRIVAVIAALALTLSVVGTAFAGSTGYEGQPGNQSNGGENNSGQSGYEGQPGNQGS